MSILKSDLVPIQTWRLTKIDIQICQERGECKKKREQGIIKLTGQLTNLHPVTRVQLSTNPLSLHPKYNPMKPKFPNLHAPKYTTAETQNSSL